MRAKDLSVVSAEPEVVVAVTNPSGTRKNNQPPFHVVLSLGLAAGVLIFGFQNCAVDLSTSTPGASTLGACAAAPAQALIDIQPVISNVIQPSCSSCHGVNSGSVKSAFYVPDTTTTVDSAAASFTYTQLCVRGGKAVGLKIDGSNSHGGGSFSRSGPQSSLYTFLNTYF